MHYPGSCSRPSSRRVAPCRNRHRIRNPVGFFSGWECVFETVNLGCCSAATSAEPYQMRFVRVALRCAPSVRPSGSIGDKCGEWRLGAVATWLPVRMRITGPYATRSQKSDSTRNKVLERQTEDDECRKEEYDDGSDRSWHGQRTSTFPQRDSFAGTFVARRAPRSQPLAQRPRIIKPCRAAPCHGRRRRHHTRTARRMQNHWTGDACASSLSMYCL